MTPNIATSVTTDWSSGSSTLFTRRSATPYESPVTRRDRVADRAAAVEQQRQALQVREEVGRRGRRPCAGRGAPRRPSWPSSTSVPAKKISTVQAQTHDTEARAGHRRRAARERPAQELRHWLLPEHVVDEELRGPRAQDLEPDRRTRGHHHDAEGLPVGPERSAAGGTVRSRSAPPARRPPAGLDLILRGGLRTSILSSELPDRLDGSAASVNARARTRPAPTRAELSAAIQSLARRRADAVTATADGDDGQPHGGDRTRGWMRNRGS